METNGARDDAGMRELCADDRLGIDTVYTLDWGAAASTNGVADLSDAELVERCLAGDDAAWPALLSRYARLIGAVIRRYRLPEEDQADVFQDVCLALWHELPRVRERARLSPWIITVAGRHAWDARRRRAPCLDEERSEEALAELPDHDPSPEEQAARREIGVEVRAAMARLSPRCRQLLEALFFDENVSYAEVARRLGWSPNSIGPIRGRCFKELRDALEAVRSAP